MSLPGVDVSIVNISERIYNYRSDLGVRLGAFYRAECFYPLLIAPMYPRIPKALFVECGTIFKANPDKVYKTDTSDAIISGLRYEAEYAEEFARYADTWLGVDHSSYVDMSLMVLQLDAMRKNKISERFARLITGYNFDTLHPGADYINFLVRGNTLILNDEWCADGHNVATVFSAHRPPWKYVNTDEAQEFWDMLRKTPFYEDVRDEYLSWSATEKEKHEFEISKIQARSLAFANAPGGFYSTLGDNYLLTKQ
jgi:lipopolysaccharide biosynthesis glycosyltransferase